MAVLRVEYGNGSTEFCVSLEEVFALGAKLVMNNGKFVGVDVGKGYIDLPVGDVDVTGVVSGVIVVI